jgi:hypothetical protein
MDDKNNIGFSAVVGKLNDKEPEVKLRFNYFLQKYEFKLSDIFETPPEEAVSIPDEWLSQVTVPTYPVYSGGGYYAGGHHVGGPNYSRNTDHLKPYQFQKGHGASTAPEVNGNRVGPGIRSNHNYGDGLGGKHPLRELDFGEDYGMTGMEGFEGIGRFGVQELGEPQGAKATEPGPLTKVETKSSLEKRLDGQISVLSEKPRRTIILDSKDVASVETQPSIGDDRFSVIACDNGVKAAEAFTLMNDCMSELSGHDELLTESLTDMFSLLGEKSQLPVLKELFQSLPYKAQEELQTNGL